MASLQPLPNSLDSPEATSSELCPSCGKFADERGLSEVTGWCYECTPPNNSSQRDSTELALHAHADAIEHFIGEGQTVWQALDSARMGRPTCVVCGESITRAKRNSIFCRRTSECRRYSRKYVYLYRERGKSKAEALSMVLTEITGEE